MLAKALQGAATAAEKIYIESVFSTFLYTGDSSTQTITNGIDLSGKGGLVWLKDRGNAFDHLLSDSSYTFATALLSNSTSSQTSSPIDSVTSTGFVLKNQLNPNGAGRNYASWTFRKAAKFFDVVTYTGNGANRTIAHNLGSVPGCIIVKSTSQADSWKVYHRSLPANDYYLLLNSTAVQSNSVDFWNSTTPTSTEFSISSNSDINGNGATYVAYLFAHDAGGFGDSGNDSVVKCGSYTGTGSAGNFVDLGWEPQWLLIKRRSGSTADWVIHDSMRGIATNGPDPVLYPNKSDAEVSTNVISLNATGFTVEASNATWNASGSSYIYIAIRRGPMKTPTDATKVYNSVVYTGNATNPRTLTAGFAPDLVHYKMRNNSVSDGNGFASRLQGAGYALVSNSIGAEAFYNTISAFGQEGITATSSTEINGVSDYTYVANFFRRAPGFFDVVAFTSTSDWKANFSHNLGVTPQLILFKGRANADDWMVYTATTGNNSNLVLNNSQGAVGQTGFISTLSTTSVVTGSSLAYNNAAYIAYLFASCPGVSKVGSYTGTGTTLNVDCGFTNGARFVLIKRTNSTGDWYVWDTARGIVSGNDSYLLLNSTAAEVTNTDYIDPLSSGFQISSTAPAAINANGGSFIFLAIA